ncbi:MAG: glutamate synthase large subunit [Bacteroidota bacterium]
MISGSLNSGFDKGEATSQNSLYHPSFEHDACGIGCIAHLRGEKSHEIVEDALQMLENMEHRGATGADPATGDGAGILLQLHHPYFQRIANEVDIDLPAAGTYGVGMIFFPKELSAYMACKELIKDYCKHLKFDLLGYRKVPTRAKMAGIGRAALDSQPIIEQVFVAPQTKLTGDELERKLYVLRRSIGHNLDQVFKGEFYFTSFSHKTIIYKGQLTTHQLKTYFSDLQDPRLKTALAVVHSRFSTNTFPRWRLAQPFRYLAHNGEINTHRGNINWLKTKEAVLSSKYFTYDELQLIRPICDEDFSDSRNLDAVAELLLLSGRSLPHVMMMLMPEAWQNNNVMDEERRAFYEYHAGLTEPWDGPAAVCFTDGVQLGATLDRNGLRPSRYILTEDNRLILASEAGALPVDPTKVKKRGRLGPGKMILANTETGELLLDKDVKTFVTKDKPYQNWLKEEKIELTQLPEPHEEVDAFKGSLTQRQVMFGITREEVKVLLKPMALNGKEPIGSMGADTPLAVLSQQSQHLSNYFKQLFAQVSNPPIDPIREKIVMSLKGWIGGSKNFLTESKEHCRHIALDSPILRNNDLGKIRQIANKNFNAVTLPIVIPEGESLQSALHRLCKLAEKELDNEKNILILSDKSAGENLLPIPALLATGAVHHHLIRKEKRHKTALIVETGDAREVHHFATLIGFGAVAVNPYLAFQTLENMLGMLDFQGFTYEQLERNYILSLQKGLYKVMSKMGISTMQSYHGAQIFEILGLSKEVSEECFTGTVSRINGLDYEDLKREVKARHELAFPKTDQGKLRLAEGGLYQWKLNGETHLFNPESIHLLQKSTKLNDFQLYKKYAQKINEQGAKAVTLRSLFELTEQNPIPLEEVEPVENILKRFATGAMSFGSISHEAHATLAMAMNRIGGKSNSGEGGEDPMRFPRRADGDWERSATKQIASGRFGVTMHYLSEAEELQIKIAQGAKPGEGGQLPGHKVDDWIGRVRHSTPGVGLISPPPHHDIYSIEDLAQLIFDLKNANPKARISVKLVAKGGVGTIAAGVTKAHADHILISGYDGGTGASPLSSIRHAGLPWEMGLAETHQTLVKNRLRNRVTIQADGGMKTGLDLVIATLLGAEEWGIATAALVVEGCILMRKCHLNTCPVGIATQNKTLRERFTGKVEHLVNFFHFLAEDLREHMALLGFRTVNEMVGQVNKLKVREDLSHWKHQKIDLSTILFKEEGVNLFKNMEQDHGIDHILDEDLILACHATMETRKPTKFNMIISNVNRSVGTMLSHKLIKETRGLGLPEGLIHLKFKGSAGQSFGAFTINGIRLELEGEANDYVGKGLSGAEMIIYPDKEAPYSPGKNIIIGNVALYGATGGKVFIRGMAGERFAVRNSGAHAVVEGVGDHGCEYMTGGRIIVLGQTGKNFAAGMSGGIAYVYDPDKTFIQKVNQELVELNDPMNYEDTSLIKNMIRQHHALTGSRIAMKLITDWDAAFSHFVKVIPTDYKRALLENGQDEGAQVKKLIG